MMLTLVWTARALKGYDDIIGYLERNWSDKEVEKFIRESEDFFELLRQFPELLRKTHHHKNVYRGPLNPLTIITYRVKPRKKSKLKSLTFGEPGRSPSGSRCRSSKK